MCLDKLLATTRAVRSRNRFMCTSTIRSKMGIIDGGNWMIISTVKNEGWRDLQSETGVVERMYW
jgi:hypothetical protein